MQWNKSLFALAGANLYSEAEPAAKDLCALTVGPLSDDLAEVARLSKVLYQMTVEPMDVGALRKAASLAKPPDGEKWGSIRYLQDLVAQVSRCTSEDAATAVEPLKRLNQLRQADAHPKELSLEKVCDGYGVTSPPKTFCDLWDAVVDQTVACLQAVANALPGKSSNEEVK